MSDPNSNSNAANPTATPGNGKANNLERLGEALSGIIGKTLTDESLEALLLDAIGALGFRLHSVEGESDDHESDFERFTEKFTQVESRLTRVETALKFVHQPQPQPQPKPTSQATDDENDERSFEILSHASNVKTVIEKSGLRGIDPDAADAIWRSADSIQQLLDRALAAVAA